MGDKFWEALAQDAYDFWSKKYPSLSPWNKITAEARTHFKEMVMFVAKRLVERGKAALK